MPRPLHIEGRQGHYGRGIGLIDVSPRVVSRGMGSNIDLAGNSYVYVAPGPVVGPINPYDAAGNDLSNTPQYAAAVLQQWENAAAQAAADNQVSDVLGGSQAMVWLSNNWPLLTIGGIVGLLLVKGI